MKLTSRALKVGDIIIRKTPLTNNALYTTIPVIVLQKNPHHTVVKVKYSVSDTEEILLHHKWNDNEWVRFKTSNNEQGNLSSI